MTAIDHSSILKEIGKGERVALSKLAIEHLERTNRPLRIAIDAAIWNFQNQASQGGKNPALRTLFFRLLKLLALPIHPIFIYDGRNKPLTKRGRTVSRYGTCIENETARQLLSAFRFPHHTAPGEAEAECAFLQKKGVVDAVMSQDVDAIMFGSTLTLRDWSKEGTKGNKTPTHVNVLDLPGIKSISGLDSDGMILVALLSGGDYDENGVAGFGSTLACEIARAGFGSDLIELVRIGDQEGLKEWRERLEYELQTNESGYFKTRHLKLKLPEDFPNLTLLGYYTKPAVSKQEDLPELERKWCKEWKTELDVPALRQYTASNFDWHWKSGARIFVRRMAQPLLQDRLLRGTTSPLIFYMDHITNARRHFINDGMEELRLNVVPAQVVGIDIEAEEDNPENVAGEVVKDLVEEEEEEGEEEAAVSTKDPASVPPMSPSRPRRQPWSPYNIERWWIPQTLLQLGLPVIVEEWQQKQRDILADPKKFAARKCSKALKATKKFDAGMKTGALTSFLIKTTDTKSFAPTQANISPKRVPRTPTKVNRDTSVEEFSPSVTRFFKTSKELGSLQNNMLEALNANDTKVADSSVLHEALSQPALAHPRPASSRSDDHNPKRLANGLSNNQDSPRSKQTSRFCASTATPNIDDSSTLKPMHLTAAGVSDGDLRLPHVTQRKKRRQKQFRSRVPTNSSLNHKSEPISVSASFISEYCTLSTGKLTKSNLRTAPEHALLSDKPTSPKPKVHPSQSIVTSRDSLPGAWRMASVDLGQNKKAPRVSYVDLTGD